MQLDAMFTEAAVKKKAAKKAIKKFEKEFEQETGRAPTDKDKQGGAGGHLYAEHLQLGNEVDDLAAQIEQLMLEAGITSDEAAIDDNE
jgi:hypothetical protein